MAGRAARVTAATAAVVAAAALAASSAGAAPPYPDAVVMVSGYNSSTPFTTPEPGCAGQEGGTWGDPAGPAASLRAAGLAVFTAPVHRGSDPVPAPCAPDGTPVPGQATEIDSYGDNDANGAALAAFLDFLHTQYGVQRVQLVAHSDGGNWSRSALTQSSAFAGLDVRSLTTLGTPYTGSMVADLGTELRNGKCDFSDPIEQAACDALLDVIEVIYDGAGPTAVAELTRTYLQGWNARQRIGSCPVTTVAGTGLDLPLIPFSYYNPSDGLVGEASALAHAAYALPSFDTIPAPVVPGLRSGGTYPVVHAPSLSFISAANLLNTPAVSSDVADIVTSTPAGPLCNPPATAHARRGLAESSNRYVLPLRFHVVPSKDGTLGRPARGDVVVARAGARVRCGNAEIPVVPLLGDRRVSIGIPDDCDERLRISGSRRQGLLLRAHTTRDVVATVGDGQIRIRLRGGAGNVRAFLDVDGSRTRLELDERGRAELPQDGGSATLTVRVGADGRALTASAVLAL